MFSSYNFDWSVLSSQWPLLFLGAWINLWVSFFSFVVALAIGMVVALMRLSRNRALSLIGVSYVQFAQGIPAYVFLLWVHFGLASLLGFAFAPLESIIIVLSITSGGYTAEIFRSGIITLDKGPIEAAHSLGLRPVQVFFQVVLPQALRIVIPPFGNIWVSTLKNSTLMGVIAVPDLLHEAQAINVNYFAPFEAFTAVMIIFVMMVAIIALTVRVFEHALEHP